jgi:nitroimidazol reductase NimA-like FMN-containing flavoprotein (pyridoxamine 5'-phosphate oxidase superfamily)
MMVLLSPSETRFLASNECCRLATCYENRPHVVPVSYLFYKDCIYISTDYKTKKFINIKKNPCICLVVDYYLPGSNKGLVLNGEATIVENGKKYCEIYKLFYTSFKWVRDDPWEEGEAPFLEIRFNSKSSWGL